MEWFVPKVERFQQRLATALKLPPEVRFPKARRCWLRVGTHHSTPHGGNAALHFASCSSKVLMSNLLTGLAGCKFNGISATAHASHSLAACRLP
jgi:hypothetical protein